MSAYHFFLANAPFSYDSKTQTRMQGRIECAKQLAAAEERGRNFGLCFAWAIDTDATSADWIANDIDGGADCDPWNTFVCTCYDANGTALTSLGGIDFGRDGVPWQSPNKRVIEAELAQQAMLDYERRLIVRGMVSDRWHSLLDAKILGMPSESPVGRDIIKYLAKADALIADCKHEAGATQGICKVVVDVCNVWYFG